MLGTVLGCVSITNAVYSLINYTLTIDYDIEMTSECDFFKINEVQAFLFVIAKSGSIEQVQATYMTKKLQKLHNAHNTIEFIVQRADGGEADFRQGVLLFDAQGTVKQVTIPRINAVYPVNELIQVLNFKIYRSSSQYRMLLKYYYSPEYFLESYDLMQVIVMDNHNISEFYTLTFDQTDDSIIQHMSPFASPARGEEQTKQHNILFSQVQDKIFEAGEVFAKLEALIYTNITLVFMHVDTERQIYVRKTDVFIDNSASSGFNKPEVMFFHDKIAFVLNMQQQRDLDSMLVSAQLGKKGNAEGRITMLETSVFSERQLNLTSLYLSVGCGNYMSDAGYRNLSRHYLQLYQELAAANSSIQDYELNISIDINRTNELPRRKEWPDVGFTTYPYEVKQLIVSTEGIDALICSHFDYEKREDVEILVYYKPSQDQQVVGYFLDFNSTGLKFKKSLSLAIGCARYKFSEEDFFFAQEFVMYVLDSRYQFDNIMKQLYYRRFTVIGLPLSKGVEYLFHLTNGNFLYATTNYIFDISAQWAKKAIISAGVLCAQIILVIAWNAAEQVKKRKFKQGDFTANKRRKED